MTKSEIHKQRILEILRENKERGINSKVLISQVTPRWSARKRELIKDGYSFKTKRESIGGSNYIRLWLLNSPGETVKKVVRYEFIGDVARPIYE